MSKQVESSESLSKQMIKLNVGGHFYSTSRSTIAANVDAQSYFGRILNKQFSSTKFDELGNYFIDRDGKYFRYILNYFRDKNCSLPESTEELKELLAEAKFYQLDRLMNEIENRLNRTNEVTKERISGFYVTVISNLSFDGEILQLIAPLKLLVHFHLKTITEKYFQTLSPNFDLEKIVCRMSFINDDDQSSVRCQPIDPLQQLVLAKQAKRFCFIVSYSNDFIYLPIENSTVSYEKLKTIFDEHYNPRCQHRSVIKDESYRLMEHWFLSKKTLHFIE